MSSDEPQGPPPAPAGETPSPDPMATGGIYIRWRDQLWQEQPDGSYLLWNDETREWEASTVQPPADPDRKIATRECPSCGRRVRTSARSCPYCERSLAAPQQETRRVPERETAAAAASWRERRGPFIVALAVLLAIGVPLGLFRYRQSELCERWKAGVRAVTETALRLKGPPPGITEAELYALNEERMAEQRPGGCE